MKITGAMLIGKSEVMGTHGSIRAFHSFRETSLAERARFLRRIGQGILNLGDALIDRAHAETSLPKGRLEGERGRTVGQLEMFASIVEGGRWIAP
jgi:alpha-ketoglutaric semialdehyde dehydrogenase